MVGGTAIVGTLATTGASCGSPTPLAMDAGYSYGQPGVGFLTDEEVANKGSALVDVLSCVLTRLVAANDQVRWRGCHGGAESRHHRVLYSHRDVSCCLCCPTPHRGRAQKLIGRRPTMTKFHALRPPEITVHAYLQRCVAEEP